MFCFFSKLRFLVFTRPQAYSNEAQDAMLEDLRDKLKNLDINVLSPIEALLKRNEAIGGKEVVSISCLV